MAVSHVANVGTNNVKASGTTSLAVTTTATVAAYDSLVFWSAALGATAGTTVTVSGGGLTWTTEFTNISGATYSAVSTAYCPSGLASGTQLTVTWSNSCTAAAASVHEFSGLGDPTLNSWNTAASTSTTPSSGSFVNTSGNLVVGIVAVNGPTGDSFTQDSDTLGGSWGTVTSAGTTGASQTSNVTLRGAYKVTTTSDSQTYNPTLGTSRFWAADGASLTPGTVPTVSSFNVNSDVLKTISSSANANSILLKTTFSSLSFDSYLKDTPPTWVSPANGVSIYPTTPLVWQSVPATNPASFWLQRDRVLTFDSANLENYYSTDGAFEYYDGSAWVSLPSSGMPAAKTGNNVRYTPTVNEYGMTKYSRVKQSKR